MRAQDIVIGESYRFRAHPTVGYAKALEVLKLGRSDNHRTYVIVKCEHTMFKNDNMGFIRYFRPTDLQKDCL